MNRAAWALCICVFSELTLGKTVHVAECLPKPIQPTQAGPIYNAQERAVGTDGTIILAHQRQSEIYFSAAAYLNSTDPQSAINSIFKHFTLENNRDFEFFVKKTSDSQCQWLIGTILFKEF